MPPYFPPLSPPKQPATVRAAVERATATSMPSRFEQAVWHRHVYVCPRVRVRVRVRVVTFATGGLLCTICRVATRGHLCRTIFAAAVERELAAAAACSARHPTRRAEYVLR